MTPEQKAEARKMWEGGDTAQAIADQLGVSRNVVIGCATRGKWTSHAPREPKTLFDRCDALHAKLDAVLAATANVPRVPNVPRP